LSGRLFALVAGCVLAGNAISAQQAAIEKRLGPSIAAKAGALNLKSTSALVLDQSGQRVLIAAHGNSLRALVKYLDGISDEAIPELNIPTGIPLVYELDADLKPIKSYYLGDEEAVKKAAEAVAMQGKAK